MYNEKNLDSFCEFIASVDGRDSLAHRRQDLDDLALIDSILNGKTTELIYVHEPIEHRVYNATLSCECKACLKRFKRIKDTEDEFCTRYYWRKTVKGDSESSVTKHLLNN